MQNNNNSIIHLEGMCTDPSSKDLPPIVSVSPLELYNIIQYMSDRYPLPRPNFTLLHTTATLGPHIIPIYAFKHILRISEILSYIMVFISYMMKKLTFIFFEHQVNVVLLCLFVTRFS